MTPVHGAGTLLVIAALAVAVLLVSRFFAMDVKTTLKTWTVMETTLGVSIFVLALGIWAVG